MKLRNWLAATLIAVLSCSASAGLLTQTESFGTQGSTEDLAFGLGVLDHTLTIDAFDSTLGTLNKVLVTVKGQIDSEGSVTNQSDALGYAEVSLNLRDAWAVNGRSFTTGELYSASSGGYTLATGDTFNYKYSSGEYSYIMELDPALLVGDMVFNYTATLATYFGNATNSGTSTFLNRSSTATWGEVNVAYTYSTVPEPSMWILVAVAFLVLLRNKHV